MCVGFFMVVCFDVVVGKCVFLAYVEIIDNGYWFVGLINVGIFGWL